MVVHIVMFRFKEGRKEEAPALRAALESLPGLIEEIEFYEVGINEVESARSFDMSLYSKFASYEAMQRYQAHAAHQAVLKQLLDASETIHAVDYTI
ncbi:MAG: Dabb family protein [Anaerolineae bacterium]|nr:Dabb family protein [Anaerolineae bacterium]